MKEKEKTALNQDMCLLFNIFALQY